MAYVDLNPIRAKMAKTPETSDHTAIKKRIELVKDNQSKHDSLEQFVGIQEQTIGIPFKLKDYLNLVDWTGRIIRPDKRGAIDQTQPEILERLNLSADNWRILTTEFESQFRQWVGSEDIVQRVCEGKEYKRRPSTKAHHALFP